jgi:hypothetical protein
VLIGVVIGLPAASTGAARTASSTVPLKPLGMSATPLVTDGNRWAAFEPVAGTTRLIDARSGRAADRADPAGCTGGLIAVGSVELLYNCQPPGCASTLGQGLSQPYGPCYNQAGFYLTYRYVIEEIHSGARHDMPGVDRMPPDANGAELTLNAIGKQWAGGALAGYHAYGLVYLNWHTGQNRTENGAADSPARAVENLDAPGLLRPLCPPLRRVVTGPDIANSPPIWPLSYAPPFAITLNEQTGNLQLNRCGSARTRKLRGSSVQLPQLGGSVISWVAFTTAGATIIHTARLNTTSRTWLAPVRSYIGKQPSALQHTATTIYTTTPVLPQPASQTGRYQIYSARIP